VLLGIDLILIALSGLKSKPFAKIMQVYGGLQLLGD
jgi:hypothetical protein